MAAIEQITLAPLVVVSALAAFILATAWRGFAHMDHALTWAASFGLLSALWLGRLLIATTGGGTALLPLLLPMLGGAAVVLGAIGFRQRALLPPLHGPFGASWALQVSAALALAAHRVDATVIAAPFYLHTLGLLLIAARTLIGRRRTERMVERGVQCALAGAAAWIFLRLIDTIDPRTPLIPALPFAAAIAQPAAVMAASLFAIFLIAADLADRLRRMANTDPLTGALNRRGFEEAIDAVLTSARRHGRSIVLLAVDIDHFKAINDRFGHAAGDEVIRALVGCITSLIARRDLVARIGGEEFAVVLTDVDAQAALCAAEVMRERIGGLFPADGVAVTASFGLAPFADAAMTRQELLARADAALYRSKQAGRDRVTMAA